MTKVSRTIGVAPGPEDFAFDREGPRGPRLIVAALDRHVKPRQPGAIWSVDLNGGQKKKLESPPIFPAGIDLVGKTLYVTSDPPDAPPSIAVFDLDGDTLRPRKPLSDKLIESPNDVAAAANGDAYITNLGGVLPLSKKGNVIKYDAAKNAYSVFAGGIAMANGIAVDEASRRLFVNSFGSKRIEVFDFDGNHLTAIPVDGHPDNLQWEVPGKVLNVAMHASQLKIVRHFRNPNVVSPSLGIRVHVAGEPRVEPLYDLPQFSGGSTALCVDGTLYVSQVMGGEIAVIENCA